jgi:hypothetical protein
MPLGVFEQRCEHDWENDFDVITDKVAKIFVVPEI